jgi:hypothetical protein
MIRQSLLFVSAAAIVLAGCRAEPAAAQVRAFPGAEGAGAYSLGGRGGRVIHVTNLNDSGPGSLRAAVDAKGARTVIFDIGGTIRLSKPLAIRNGRITIAGQTAPGGGITIRDQRLHVAADDVVVRFIRSRLGDESRVTSDSIWVAKGRRIILDHVSASWSTDETLSVSSTFARPGDVLDGVTVQWSIISESLCAPGKPQGRHCYGSLAVTSRGGKMSFHHNLWAHHQARMPRTGNYLTRTQDPVGGYFDFRSNVFYNWGDRSAGYNSSPAVRVHSNFVANSYIAGPDSKGRAAFDERDALANAWFQGNSMNGVIPANPWSLVIERNVPNLHLSGPVPMPPVTTDPPAAAYARVLADAGSSLVRDAVDRRIVDNVKTRSGGLIDSQRDVGGWPVLARGTPWRDSDGDGMPDDWERAHGFNPRDGRDGNLDADRDGYTNVEEWLNALAAPAMQ